MEFMKGYTFLMRENEKVPFAGAETKKSLHVLKDCTGCDTIILAVGALQEHPQSETVEFRGSHIPTDDELRTVVGFARELGLRIILKPMLNCRNGVWRAHINFFDKEVPCEPKWSKWFESYSEYLLHYADLAEELCCEMLVIGCEMVQTERKEAYWRSLVAKIRKRYTGLLTYNTDKYQEEEVKWWDCLDVISASGYYPQSKWEENLDRIEAVVKRYQKPFFFAECGCMCREGCEEVPNDWTFTGKSNIQVQADYVRNMFQHCSRRSWIDGYGFWAWVNDINLEEEEKDDGYGVYGKPSCQVIRDFYTQNKIL